MSVINEEQAEEMVREAVEKTEKSFGGTFKRLKSENEELKSMYETTLSDSRTEREEMDKRVKELEAQISDSKKYIIELAVKGEIQKQFSEKGALPEEFIDPGSIEYSEDPELLSANVAKELERGRKSLEKALQEIGVSAPQTRQATVNPTNPPSRDTKTAHDMKSAESKEVLHNMMKRGLIR